MIKGAYEVHAFNTSLDEMAVAFLDISERKQLVEEKMRLEEQLRQTQKMEAVGTLAGGIAHDFNNLLSAIIGYSELAKMESPSHGKIAGYLDNSLTAASRAKDLVQQILAFSRKAETKIELFNPHTVVSEALRLLRASIPTTVKMEENLDESPCMVMGDSSQFHQVIVNLCTNAYQAMRDGGALSVKLEKTEVDEVLAKKVPGIEAGSYVCMEIADTGVGIPAEILDRIFEPFFTTKEFGEGTGMGLAVIHGIVSNFNGGILVESELNVGSTFRVYLPCAHGDMIEETLEKATSKVAGGKALVVDDESTLAELGATMLESIGFEAVSFTSPVEALQAFKKAPHDFDLVLSDQTMPEMTGLELFKEILSLRPHINAILYTGYSDVANKEIALGAGIKGFLYKPLDRQTLTDEIDRISKLKA